MPALWWTVCEERFTEAGCRGVEGAGGSRVASCAGGEIGVGKVHGGVRERAEDAHGT